MFFDDIDGNSVLERNVSRLEGLELLEIRKLIKAFKQAREEIRNQLLITPDNTFTEAKLKIALENIDRNLRILNQKLNPLLKFSFDAITEQSFEDSAKEVNSFEKIFTGVSNVVPIGAIVESTDPENFLFNQYQSSIETYSMNLRQEFQRVLGQSLIQNKTWTQAVNDMDGVFNASEYILARIVRTELHNIYNVSKLGGFTTIKNNYLPDLKKTMYHPMDSRTGDDSILMARTEMIVDLDKPFVFKYKGKTQTFMAPPNRPNDRAILIPYRNGYDK